VCEVGNVVVPPLVGFQERLDVTPLGLSGVAVIPPIIDETNVINGTVPVTLNVKESLLSPAITVVLGSIQASITVFKVLAVMSGTEQEMSCQANFRHRRTPTGP